MGVVGGVVVSGVGGLGFSMAWAGGGCRSGVSGVSGLNAGGHPRAVLMGCRWGSSRWCRVGSCEAGGAG